MAPLTRTHPDRRREPRRSGGGSRWQTSAVLRPGQPIILVNINSRAALVESGARLRPGAHTELQLAGPGARVSIRGRLDRCQVTALEPLRFRGVLIFDERFALIDDDDGSLLDEAAVL
jgi:hypothetical protein